MESGAGGRYRYPGGNAELYGSPGIEGTTCQIGFDAVAEVAAAECGSIPAATAEASASAARLAAWTWRGSRLASPSPLTPPMVLVIELARTAGEHGMWVYWERPRRTSPVCDIGQPAARSWCGKLGP